MKKIFLLVFIGVFSVNFPFNADANELTCSSSSQVYPYINCLLNQIDSCDNTYTSCKRNNYIVSTDVLVSKMINRCCVPGRSDAQWDDCFLAQVRQLNKSKVIPAKFKRNIRNRINAYINDAEVQCTEA